MLITRLALGFLSVLVLFLVLNNKSGTCPLYLQSFCESDIRVSYRYWLYNYNTIQILFAIFAYIFSRIVTLVNYRT